MSILENEKRREMGRGKYRAKVERSRIVSELYRIHCGEILYVSKRFDWARINFPTEREREREIPDPSTNPSRVLPLRHRYSLSLVFAQPGGERKKEKKEKRKISLHEAWIGVARFPRNDNNPSFFSRGRWTAAPPRSVYTRSTVQTTLSKWISAPK